MKQSFTDRLAAIRQRKNSVLCVGIDPDPDKLPPSLSGVGSIPDQVSKFSKEIILSTASSAAAFKFNLAFFEALGKSGWTVLQDVLASVPSDVLTIADAKRGDIGNSARFYAKALLEDLPFDAITLSPFMGCDSVVPFLGYAGKAVFILARTSNPGGSDFQTLLVNGEPLYMNVARQALTWSTGLPGIVGLVTGARDTAALASLRKLCPNTPFLVPGIGAQGGRVDLVMQAAGFGPILVHSSRAIIYSASGEDFSSAASVAAEKIRMSLQEAHHKSIRAS